MNFDAIITLVVVAVIFFVLLKNWAQPDVLFLGATAFLSLIGIITPKEAFAGFSNEGMLTVALLFVIAAALRDTGVLDLVGHHVLGKATSERSALGRLGTVVIPMSAFLNNTPIVAMFMPIVLEWSRRRRISPSKLLIPLSYVAILGGTCTLIGTSTNLVVNGLMIDAGLPEMRLFEIGKAGLPYAIIGLVYLFFARRFLPDRKELLEQLGESLREYLLEMRVQAHCRLVGQSVQAAGLRHLPGLFLIEIDRDGSIIGPVGPEEVIRAEDRLVFTGIVSSIVELERIPGLDPVADPSYELSPGQQQSRRLCEAVVSQNSPLIGKTIRDADFRAVYGAAVVAVHRGGGRVEKKIGDIVLQGGDTLLLQTGPHFLRVHRNDPAFYLVSAVEEWRPPRRDRAWLAIALFVALLVFMTTGLMSTLVAAAIVAVVMILSGCITAGEARRSIEWQVLVTIAASFGVGAALENSGAAESVARVLVGVTSQWGTVAALAAIYLAGMVVTELITNNAAAVLVFPFCIETARLCDANPRPFLMALVLAASASFMTPIGYQTNMMVYGPGGYRFGDFIKFGGPLSLILWATAVVLIPIFWPF